MQDGWKDDDSCLQAINDLIMHSFQGINDLLNSLYPYHQSSGREDVFLFAMLGPFVMAYAHSQLEGCSQHDSFHHALTEVLEHSSVVNFLRSEINKSIQAKVNQNVE